MTGPRPAIAGIVFGLPGAGSFVAAGASAFQRAQATLEAEIAIHWFDQTPIEWRLARLHDIAQAKPALIVLHGAQGEALVEALAADYPQVMFSVSQGEVCGPNVSSYEVALEQPAFLAGALAGWSSDSGVLGHLSGERVRAGLKGRAAFAAGVCFASAEARLLSTFCGAQHEPELAEACVAAQHRAGADVLFTMLGAGREGAIRACREFGVRQIGDGVDWCATHPDVFLASAVADSGWASWCAIEDFVHDRFQAGMRRTVGLEEPSVCRLVLADGVSAEINRRLGALAQDVLDGKIVVPTLWDGEEFAAPAWPD